MERWYRNIGEVALLKNNSVATETSKNYLQLAAVLRFIFLFKIDFKIETAKFFVKIKPHEVSKFGHPRNSSPSKCHLIESCNTSVTSWIKATLVYVIPFISVFEELTHFGPKLPIISMHSNIVKKWFSGDLSELKIKYTSVNARLT